MSPLSRKERERAMRREAMLDAARAVFAERGFRTATLDEIAQRAEFGKGTLYNYFEGGKDELLFAILDDLHSDLFDQTRRAFEDVVEAPHLLRDRLHAYIVDTLSYFSENQDLFLILFKEANRLCVGEDVEHMKYFKESFGRMVGTLVPSLQSATEAGVIKPLPPEALAQVILGNIDGFVKYSLFTKMEPANDVTLPSPEQAADFLTEILFEGMQARSTPTAPGDGASALNEPNPTIT